MIGSLRGRLLELFGDGEVLIEVAGVGYRVIVTPTTAVIHHVAHGETVPTGASWEAATARRGVSRLWGSRLIHLA